MIDEEIILVDSMISGVAVTTSDTNDRPATLTDRLNLLFDVVRNPDTGKPYSNREVANVLPVKVTGQYIHALRQGNADNPAAKLLVALARFFVVDPMYLLEGDTPETAGPVNRIHQQLAELRTMRDAGVAAIAMRAFELDDQGKQFAQTLLDQLVELQRSRGTSSNGDPAEQ